jgi:hypothetical protein
MISRKKRVRYKTNANKIAYRLGLPFPSTWEEIWNILDQYEEPTYLYAIGEVGGKEVKLGISKNPGQRLKQLQTAYPNKLVLWGFCKEASPLTEREVHRLLEKDRIEGEWFLLTDQVKEVVESIREVSKDTEPLE